MKKPFFFRPEHQVPICVTSNNIQNNHLFIAIPLQSGETGIDLTLGKHIFSSNKRLFLEFDLEYNEDLDNEIKFSCLIIKNVPETIELIQMRCKRKGDKRNFPDLSLTDIIEFENIEPIDLNTVGECEKYHNTPLHPSLMLKDSCTIPPK